VTAHDGEWNIWILAASPGNGPALASGSRVEPTRNMSIAQSTTLFAGRLRNRHAPAGAGRGVDAGS
jgi:hypothetical protein